MGLELNPVCKGNLSTVFTLEGAEAKNVHTSPNVILSELFRGVTSHTFISLQDTDMKQQKMNTKNKEGTTTKFREQSTRTLYKTRLEENSVDRIEEQYNHIHDPALEALGYLNGTETTVDPIGRNMR
ncbi:hypothetical protein FQA39_LY16406 [Lamprigera yunnana]|nr:hypothetical protein FQA39_LY16406 [Lamprigera yunnana]